MGTKRLGLSRFFVTSLRSTRNRCSQQMTGHMMMMVCCFTVDADADETRRAFVSAGTKTNPHPSDLAGDIIRR